MLANLRALFISLVDIMLLRRGPEHLPASPTLLAMLVVLNLLLTGLAYHTLFVPLVPDVPANWPLRLVAGALATLAWWRVAFQLARKVERFVQTMIAVFATNTLTIPAMPLVAALIPYMPATKNAEPAAAPAMLVLLMALIALWVMAVLSRIVRSAFEWSWAVSILFAVASSIGPAILLSIIFGEPQKVA
jgi:hypothetical protein